VGVPGCAALSATTAAKICGCAPLKFRSLDRQPWVFRPIHRLPRPRSHPCPEPHERAQPLPFEALNARNAGNNAITGMSTAAFDPTGGVPQPAPFAIAKSGVGPTECHISSGAWSRKPVVAGPRAPSPTANRAFSRAIPRGQPSGQSVGCSKQGLRDQSNPGM
jgi:hypothetical protein